MRNTNNDTRFEIINHSDILKPEMSPVEAKIFEYYLTSIDVKRPDELRVKLYFDRYEEITGLNQSRFENMLSTINSLFEKSISTPDASGSYYHNHHIFDYVNINEDEFGEPYFELCAHKNVLPLLYRCKEENFSIYKIEKQ